MRHASAADLSEVRALLHETFCGEKYDPGALAPFYLAYEQCDPEFLPEQYIYRRMRGRVVSALKVFVRRLHHPSGPVKVTFIGGVCTRAKLRGRGLIGPVIERSLEYSRAIGAAAEMIVTPRKDYYLRHGFAYFATVEHRGPLPRVAMKGAHVEPLQYGDAAWMCSMFNRYRWGYGPVVRSERYVRKWILELRLARPENVGLKLVRNGRPAGYAIAGIREDSVQLFEAVSDAVDGADEARLLSFFRLLGRDRFTCRLPDANPLIRFLKRRTPLERTVAEHYMHYPLDPSFPIPGDEFCHSPLDHV